MTAGTHEFTEAGVSARADTVKGVVHVVADIAASPEAVFRALTDPRELAHWWGAEGVYRTERWEIDLRPGGKWKSYIAAPENSGMADPRTPEPQTVGGEYLTVDPPSLLEYTWLPSWDGFAVSTVRCEIEKTAAGSRLTVTHSGFGERSQSAKDHGEGWVRVIAWLARALEGGLATA
ncbi:MAG: SRPBCC domain-containing protein [Gemmatimonadaceae bacterium]|nr:SRPBCC domain-containing protein [Gemmatimonadaceae bacterium]